MRSYIVIAVAVMFIVGAVVGFLAYRPHSSSAASVSTVPSCVPQANEKCFPKTFVEQYQEFLELQQEAVGLQKTGKFVEWQHKQREVEGFASELKAELEQITPKGYTPDLDKLKFAEIPPPALPAPATPK